MDHFHRFPPPSRPQTPSPYNGVRRTQAQQSQSTFSARQNLSNNPSTYNQSIPQLGQSGQPGRSGFNAVGYAQRDHNGYNVPQHRPSPQLGYDYSNVNSSRYLQRNAFGDWNNHNPWSGNLTGSPQFGQLQHNRLGNSTYTQLNPSNFRVNSGGHRFQENSPSMYRGSPLRFESTQLSYNGASTVPANSRYQSMGYADQNVIGHEAQDNVSGGNYYHENQCNWLQRQVVGDTGLSGNDDVESGTPLPRHLSPVQEDDAQPEHEFAEDDNDEENFDEHEEGENDNSDERNCLDEQCDGESPSQVHENLDDTFNDDNRISEEVALSSSSPVPGQGEPCEPASDHHATIMITENVSSVSQVESIIAKDERKDQQTQNSDKPNENPSQVALPANDNAESVDTLATDSKVSREQYFNGEGLDPVEEYESRGRNFKPLKNLTPPTKNNIISNKQADWIRSRLYIIPPMPTIARTTPQLYFAFLYLLSQRDWVDWDSSFMNDKSAFFMQLLPRFEYPSRLRHITNKRVFMERLEMMMLDVAEKHWKAFYKDEFEEPVSYDDVDPEHPNFNDISVPYKDFARLEDAELLALTDILLKKRDWDFKHDAALLAQDPPEEVPITSGRNRFLMTLTEDAENPEKLFNLIAKYQNRMANYLAARKEEDRARLSPEEFAIVHEEITEEDFIAKHHYWLPLERDKRIEAKAAAQAAARDEAARQLLHSQQKTANSNASDSDDKEAESPLHNKRRSSYRRGSPAQPPVSGSKYSKSERTHQLKRDTDVQRSDSEEDGNFKTIFEGRNPIQAESASRKLKRLQEKSMKAKAAAVQKSWEESGRERTSTRASKMKGSARIKDLFANIPEPEELQEMEEDESNDEASSQTNSYTGFGGKTIAVPQQYGGKSIAILQQYGGKTTTSSGQYEESDTEMDCSSQQDMQSLNEDINRPESDSGEVDSGPEDDNVQSSRTHGTWDEGQEYFNDKQLKTSQASSRKSSPEYAEGQYGDKNFHHEETQVRDFYEDASYINNNNPTVTDHRLEDIKNRDHDEYSPERSRSPSHQLLLKHPVAAAIVHRTKTPVKSLILKFFTSGGLKTLPPQAPLTPPDFEEPFTEQQKQNAATTTGKSKGRALFAKSKTGGGGSRKRKFVEDFINDENEDEEFTFEDAIQAGWDAEDSNDDDYAPGGGGGGEHRGKKKTKRVKIEDTDDVFLDDEEDDIVKGIGKRKGRSKGKGKNTKLAARIKGKKGSGPKLTGLGRGKGLPEKKGAGRRSKKMK